MTSSRYLTTYKLYAQIRELSILHHPKHFDIYNTHNYLCPSKLQSL